MSYAVFVYTYEKRACLFGERNIIDDVEAEEGKKSEFYVFIPIFVTLPQHTVLGLGGCRMSMPKADFFSL